MLSRIPLYLLDTDDPYSATALASSRYFLLSLFQKCYEIERSLLITLRAENLCSLSVEIWSQKLIMIESFIKLHVGLIQYICIELFLKPLQNDIGMLCHDDVKDVY